MLDLLTSGLSVVFAPKMFILIIFAVFLGTLFGALPGVSATMAVTLGIPFTYKMDAVSAIAFLVAIYCASITGGGMTAIDAAVQACRRMGNQDITLLKCTSSYPAPVEEANLLTIPNMRQTFGVKVGLSDHTLGEAVAMAASMGLEAQFRKTCCSVRLGGGTAGW